MRPDALTLPVPPDPLRGIELPLPDDLRSNDGGAGAAVGVVVTNVGPTRPLVAVTRA